LPIGQFFISIKKQVQESESLISQLKTISIDNIHIKFEATEPTDQQSRKHKLDPDGEPDANGQNDVTTSKRTKMEDDFHTEMRSLIDQMMTDSLCVLPISSLKSIRDYIIDYKSSIPEKKLKKIETKLFEELQKATQG
jgi:hypothetical protein